MGGVELRLVLRVSQESDGSLSATVDSPDQGAMDLKVGAIELGDGGVTRFEMKTLSAMFEGTRDDGGATIVGDFTQAGTSLPLILRWRERASSGGRRNRKSPIRIGRRRSVTRTGLAAPRSPAR